MFESRLGASAPYCLAAVLDGTLVGYFLAHGWVSNFPPPLGAILTDEVPIEVLYIHDLAVARSGRGGALGRRLVTKAFEMAAADGLTIAELIAVERAAGFWKKLDFDEPEISPALAARVAAYGHGARWMARTIP